MKLVVPTLPGKSESQIKTPETTDPRALPFRGPGPPFCAPDVSVSRQTCEALGDERQVRHRLLPNLFHKIHPWATSEPFSSGTLVCLSGSADLRLWLHVTATLTLWLRFRCGTFSVNSWPLQYINCKLQWGQWLPVLVMQKQSLSPRIINTRGACHGFVLSPAGLAGGRGNAPSRRRRKRETQRVFLCVFSEGKHLDPEGGVTWDRPPLGNSSHPGSSPPPGRIRSDTEYQNEVHPSPASGDTALGLSTGPPTPAERDAWSSPSQWSVVSAG